MLLKWNAEYVCVVDNPAIELEYRRAQPLAKDWREFDMIVAGDIVDMGFGRQLQG